jgi:hypothetical protein
VVDVVDQREEAEGHEQDEDRGADESVPDAFDDDAGERGGDDEDRQVEADVPLLPLEGGAEEEEGGQDTECEDGEGAIVERCAVR